MAHHRIAGFETPFRNVAALKARALATLSLGAGLMMVLAVLSIHVIHVAHVARI